MYRNARVQFWTKSLDAVLCVSMHKLINKIVGGSKISVKWDARFVSTADGDIKIIILWADKMTDRLLGSQ